MEIKLPNPQQYYEETMTGQEAHDTLIEALDRPILLVSDTSGKVLRIKVEHRATNNPHGLFGDGDCAMFEFGYYDTVEDWYKRDIASHRYYSGYKAIEMLRQFN